MDAPERPSLSDFTAMSSISAIANSTGFLLHRSTFCCNVAFPESFSSVSVVEPSRKMSLPGVSSIFAMTDLDGFLSSPGSHSEFYFIGVRFICPSRHRQFLLVRGDREDGPSQYSRDSGRSLGEPERNLFKTVQRAKTATLSCRSLLGH